MKKTLLAITLLGSILFAQAFSQNAAVTTTTAPVVIHQSADLQNLAIPDGQVVIIADPAGGTILIYDVNSSDAVDDSTVFNGPNSIGRFKAMSVTTGGVIDTSMSDVSTNPVTNAAIKAYVDATVAGGTIDDAMSDVSNNAVANSVIKAYVDAAVSGGTIDTAMSDVSENAVQNKVIKAYIDAQAGLTVDDTMSDVSTNPVQNAIVKAYIDSTVAGGTIDDAMSAVSENAVQNKVIKAYVDSVAVGGTIDDAMSLNSQNAVQNSVITAYVDNRSEVQTYDYIVTNTSEFTAAATAIDTLGYGTMWIVGNVTIPSGTNIIEAACSIRALGPGACLTKDGSNPGTIAIGDHSTDPLNNGFGTMDGEFLLSDLNRFANDFAAPGLDAEAGDWILLMSDSDVTERPWHSTSNPASRAEMVQVRRVHDVSGTDYYVLNGFTTQDYTTRDGPNFTASGATLTSNNHGLTSGQRIHVESTGTLPGNLAADTVYWVRDVTTNTFGLSATDGGSAITTSSAGSGTHTTEFRPKAAILPIVKHANANASHVLIENIEFKSINTPALENIFEFQNLDTIEIKNCKWERIGTQAGPSWMGFGYCANINIHHNYVSSVNDIDGSSYWVVLKTCNGVHVHENFGQETRHFVTTGGEAYTAGGLNRRTGGPTRVLVSNNVVHASQNTSAEGLPCMDTHCEGWGVTFMGNHLVTTGSGVLTSGSGYAIHIRSQFARVLDNVIEADGFAGGMQIGAPNCIVSGNTFYNTLFGVGQSAQPSSVASSVLWDRMIVTGNVFQNSDSSSTGAPLRISGGNYHTFSNNVFQKPEGWVMRAQNGDNLRFVGNHIFEVSTGGSGSVLAFEGNHDNCVVMDNVFSEVRTTVGTPTQSVVHFEGTGNNNEVSHNVFHDCKVAALVEYEGGTGHRVAMNDLRKDLNTNSIDLGSTITDTNIDIIGNAMDGYGSNDMGLGGTFNSTVEGTYTSKNWTD